MPLKYLEAYEKDRQIYFYQTKNSVTQSTVCLPRKYLDAHEKPAKFFFSSFSNRVPGSQIHECTISLRFLGIILEDSVWIS